MVDEIIVVMTTAAMISWRWRVHWRPCARVRQWSSTRGTPLINSPSRGADIVVMLHRDYQYTPRLLPAMASIIANGLRPSCWAAGFWAVMRSGAGRPGGSMFQTVLLSEILSAHDSEYHTGYRAFSRGNLETLDIGKEFRRFCFRQPEMLRANPLARIYHCRSQLSDQIFWSQSISAAVSNMVWSVSASSSNSGWRRCESELFNSKPRRGGISSG